MTLQENARHVALLMPIKLVDDPHIKGKTPKVPYISLDHQLCNALAVWLKRCTNRDWAPISCSIYDDGARILIEGMADTKPPLPPDWGEDKKPDFRYLTRSIDAPKTIARAKHIKPLELTRLYY
ncbi:hypothetical protein INS90_09785 [Trueperella pecoris]|uniref:Uncharacterized protein n=1 Tax=Trueperella pecoris TaxID=2733571 RepID=A0A7M1QZL4_9ACTO|nr:hypothetical protein [Trueperella pecoris]QOR47522.1 hypothetical protein INS90_09785 [Trueperella pecoris]